MYNAIVTRLKNVRELPGADNLKLATCHGNQVVVGINAQEGDIGVYFPSDGQLSHEFCKANNLYRDNLLNVNPNAKPGMFDENRRVRAQKLRKQVSDGFWTSFESFTFLKSKKVMALSEGFEFDALEGVPICNKYVNPKTAQIAAQTQGKKTRAAKSSKMFKEHRDTSHFDRNVDEVKDTDVIIITEKYHGTSHRVGHVLVDRILKWFERLLVFFGIKINTTEWSYLNGTRRVVLEEAKTNATQFHDPTIRERAFQLFKGNLRKGETVYLEIVGYENGDKPIMPSVDTTKMKDKEFTKLYANEPDGKTMTFKYGCQPGTCEFYVYRMSVTNDDGHSVDYTWDDVMRRCNEIGVKHVPEVARFTVAEFKLKYKISDDRDFSDALLEVVDTYSKGASFIDKTHIKEGVCVMLESGLAPRVYKHKSFEFKVVEGHVKDTGVVDMEESS